MAAKTTEKAEETKMGLYEKLNKIRCRIHSAALSKSGKNAYAGFEYFELGDFLPTALQLFDEFKITALFNYPNGSSGLNQPGVATLTLHDCESPDHIIQFSTPLAEVALKGAHSIQNLGAQITYLRRYLYMMALEIVEHDAVDKTAGKDLIAPKAAFIHDQKILDAVNSATTLEALNEAWKAVNVGVRHEYKDVFSAAKNRIAEATDATV